MRHYLKTVILTVVTFYIIYTFIPVFTLPKGPENIFLVIGGFWVLSQIIKPIFSLVLLPINLLTFGLVSVIINITYLFALENFLPGFAINAYDFPGLDYEGIVLPAMSFSEVTTVILIGFALSLIQKILHIIFE